MTDETTTEPDTSTTDVASDVAVETFDYPEATPVADMTAEQRAEYWREKAQKHEKANKALTRSDPSAAIKRDLLKAQKELETLRQASMTEAQRAVEEAEQRGRSAASADFGQRLAAAEVKAALTGIVPDPAAIVEDLNLAKYVTDTGDVDQEAVTALRSKYQALAAKPPVADLKQGVQSSEARNSLDQQIAEATAAGNHALAISLKRQKAYAPTT